MISTVHKTILVIAVPFPGYYLTGFRRWLMEGVPPDGMPAIVNFLRETAKRGYQVHITLPVLGREYPCKRTVREGRIVVYPYKIPACFSPLIKLFRWRGNFLLNFLFIFLTMIFSFGFHMRLIKHIKPLFIYQMGYNTLNGHFLQLRTGVPLVYRMFGTALGEKLDSTGHIRLNLWDRIRSTPETYIYRHPGDLMVISNDGTRGGKVMRVFGVPEQRSLFTMNGIGYQRERKSKANLRKGFGKDVFLAVTVTRLVPWKGVDRTIRAFPLVIKKEPRLRLVIVGDGNERKALEDLVRESGMEEFVKFQGVIPHDMVIDTIRQADVLISTQYVTNRSNCTLEAVMAGRPVVSLDDGSLDGFLEHMRDSLLVDTDDINEQLSSALVCLAQDPKLYGKLRKGVEKTRSQMRSWAQRINYELEVIEGVIGSGKPE